MPLSAEALLGRDDTPIPPGAPGRPWDIVFLDRDGTLNVHRPGYISRAADLTLLPGAASAVCRLNESGCRVVLVTNQRGMATGELTEARLLEVQQALVARLAEHGAWLDGIQVCPHQRDTCTCRKPLTGLFERALERAPWARADRCAVVGDQPTDLEPGRVLGLRTERVGAGGHTLREAVQLLVTPLT